MRRQRKEETKKRGDKEKRRQRKEETKKRGDKEKRRQVSTIDYIYRL